MKSIKKWPGTNIIKSQGNVFDWKSKSDTVIKKTASPAPKMVLSKKDLENRVYPTSTKAVPGTMHKEDFYVSEK